jgi:uncharacterized membrane protein YcaP (DUF421 family)
MYLSIVTALAVGVVGVLIITRFLGKKQLSQVTPIDFVYVLILGGIVDQAMYDPDIQVQHIAFTFAVWGSMIWGVETLAQRSDKFRTLIKGGKHVLIKEGVVNPKNLRRNKLEVEQLRTLLRMQGVFSIREVKYAILETSGMLSVLEKGGEAPLTKRDYFDEFEENVPTYLLIEDGSIHEKELKALGRDKDWLKTALQKEGCRLKDIYIGEWSEKDGFFIQKAEG